MELHLYDIVKLVQAREGMARGAEGTVVDEFDGGVSVEFLDADGGTRALLDVPTACVQRIERPAVPA